VEELGPAPAAGEYVAPKGDVRLRIEREKHATNRLRGIGGAHITFDEYRWRVTLTVGARLMKVFRLGNIVDEATAAPSVTWRDDGSALLAWKDRSAKPLEWVGFTDAGSMVDDLRYAVIAPDAEPVERSLGRPDTGDEGIPDTGMPAAVASPSGWWMFRTLAGELVRTEVQRDGTTREVERVALADDATPGNPFVRRMGNELAVLFTTSRRWPTSLDDAPPWSRNGLRVVLFDQDRASHVEREVHVNEHVNAVATPLDLVRGHYDLWVASALEWPGYGWSDRKPRELRLTRFTHDQVSVLHTRFDHGFSKLTLDAAKGGVLHGTFEAESKRYAFTATEVDACPAETPIECRGQVASRPALATYAGVLAMPFGSLEWQESTTQLWNPTTVVANDRRRALAGEVASVARLPAWDAVLLTLHTYDKSAITRHWWLLLDARTGDERWRLEEPSAAAWGAPQVDLSRNLGQISSVGSSSDRRAVVGAHRKDGYALLAVDERGQREQLAWLANKWHGGMFARAGNTWVFAMIVPPPESAYRKAGKPGPQRVVIIDAEGQVLHRFELPHDEDIELGWSGPDGAAFVFGDPSRPRAILLDGEGRITSTDTPLRLQFTREGETLVADPLRGELPYDVLTGAHRGCD
jgi:hypothetical protein